LREFGEKEKAKIPSAKDVSDTNRFDISRRERNDVFIHIIFCDKYSRKKRSLILIEIRNYYLGIINTLSFGHWRR